MNNTVTLYPELTLEECQQRISKTAVCSGFSQGLEVDRYTVDTPAGSVLVLVFDKFFMRSGTVTLSAVLDTVEGRIRVHLSASGAGDGGGYDRDLGAAQKMIQMVEDALRS